MSQGSDDHDTNDPISKQIIQGINISLANKGGPLHPPGSFMKEQVSRRTWAAVQVGVCPPHPTAKS